MTSLNPVRLVSAVVLLAVGFALGAAYSTTVAQAQVANRVFELRTYTAPAGKLPDLNARFRNHTMRIFQKHGMSSVGYWVPQDAPLKDNTLIYILSHESREAAAKSWAAFRADPDWVKAKAESEKDGPLTTKVESVFADPTDFSALK